MFPGREEVWSVRGRAASFGLRITTTWSTLLFILASGLTTRSDPATNSDIFLNLRARPLEYAGPENVDTNLTEIRIAWFSPTNETNHVWWAANLAVSDFSRDNPGTLPVRVLPCWSADPWSGGAATLAKTIYTEHPLAVIGGPDSASTHLAEQIAAKANLPLISPISTDPSVTLAGVPWMFSCAPSDRAIAKTLVKEVVLKVDQRNPGQFALLAGTDHESRMTTREVLGEFSRCGRLPDFKFDIQPGAATWGRQLDALTAANPSAVALITSSDDAARLVPEIRQRLPKAVLIGSQALSRSSFLRAAGPAAEGVRCPILFPPISPSSEAQRFTEQFRASFRMAPDYTAAFAYDAVRLLLNGVRESSGSRSEVLANLRLSSYRGISGEIRFDGTGQNTCADIPMGVILKGVVVRIPNTEFQAGPTKQDL